MSSCKVQEIIEDVEARAINEHGAALIMALLVLSAFSLLTAAIVFTVQAEIKSSANYKYGQQALYVANAGVQKSLNWFNTTYTPHLPTSDYNSATVPLQYQSKDVLLGGQAGSTSNYPDPATSDSFVAELGSKPLQADDKNKGQYAANASLIRSRAVRLLDTSTFTMYDSAIDRWRIDSIGSWGAAANPLGSSEVSAVIERQASPFWNKALWTTTLADIGTGTTIDSYDPGLGPYGGSNIGNSGDIGSNGDVTMSSSAVINGDVMYGPTGTFSGGSGAVTGSVSRLPAPRIFPPIADFSVGRTDFKVNDGLSHTLPPGSYGSVQSSKSGTNITLTGGIYYMDQLQISGNSTITLTPGASTALYIKSQLDLSGGAVINPDRDPALFQIYYTGISDGKLTGGGDFYGTVYAPNSTLKLAGQSNFYGSFIANRVSTSGGADIHYDEGLMSQFLTPRPYAIITWTQKSF